MKKTYNKPRGNTFRESLIHCLCDLATNEEQMRSLMKTNPEMYQFTMKVAIEEQSRRERRKFYEKE